MRTIKTVLVAAALAMTLPAVGEAKYRGAGTPPENNGTKAEAFGALKPNVQYNGATGDGDPRWRVQGQEWFYFYIRRTTRVTLYGQNYTTMGGPDKSLRAECDPFCTARFEIRNSRDQRGDALLLDGYDPEFDDPSEGRSTVRLTRGKYYVRLSGVDGKDADGQYLSFSVDGAASAFSGTRPR